MKKSEMLVKLDEICKEVFTVQNIESLENMELMEYFLAHIEKVGMLPPVPTGLTCCDGSYWENEDV